MSQLLINRNPDLKRLQDEGYDVEIRAGYLIVHAIPYVNSRGEVLLGKMVSVLELAADLTQKPSDHIMYFAGEHPCNDRGNELTKIKHQSVVREIDRELSTQHSFSSKPEGGYSDYYQKVVTYARILSNYAKELQPNRS